MAQPPQQQRPPPLLTPVEREALRRRHEAQEAQRQAQLAPSRPAARPEARTAPTPPQPPARPTPQQQALDRGQNPPAPTELEATGGVPGGSPLRQMEPVPEGATIGHMGDAAPEPVKTGPGNVQPPRWEPGDEAA